MDKTYIGSIVEESLQDNRALNEIRIVDFKISKDSDPDKRWHIYTVKVSAHDINELARNLKPGWYMHFWKDRKILAVFKEKTFLLDYLDKTTWKDAISHGLSIGIPQEQLDFALA
jgi:hypothetical protein